MNMKLRKSSIKGHGKLVDAAILNSLYDGMAKIRRTTIGNPYIIYNIAKRVSKCMRTLVG